MDGIDSLQAQAQTPKPSRGLCKPITHILVLHVLQKHPTMNALYVCSFVEVSHHVYLSPPPPPLCSLEGMDIPVYSGPPWSNGVLSHPDLDVLKGGEAGCRLYGAGYGSRRESVKDTHLPLATFKPSGQTLKHRETYCRSCAQKQGDKTRDSPAEGEQICMVVMPYVKTTK